MALGSSQQQDGGAPCNLCNEWRRDSYNEALDGRECFHENFTHFPPVKVLACKYKYTCSRPLHSGEFGSPIANSIILGEDDPPSTPNLAEPIFVTRGWWKVVIVNMHLNACLAERGSNGLLAQ